LRQSLFIERPSTKSSRGNGKLSVSLLGDWFKLRLVIWFNHDLVVIDLPHRFILIQLRRIPVVLPLELNHELLLLLHHLVIAQYIYEEAVGLASLPLQLLPHIEGNGHGLGILVALRGL
jgi:hypothetical protein